MKINVKFLVFFAILFYCTNGFAQEADTIEYQRYSISNNVDYLYAKPDSYDFIMNVPGDYVLFYKRAFRKKNLPAIGLITATTAVLLVYDQALLDGAQSLGREIGIGNADNTTTMIKIGDLSIFRGPTDIGSLIYFIGDGWLQLGISMSFLGKGLFYDDYRALQTSSQLLEGLISIGVAIQFIKHIAGRESPFVATQDGGRWDLFPNQIDYHQHVPEYDAFPSGHVAAATMTATVIAENYPEYGYIKPVGYTLISLLSLQMMNNGTHWASDYPLGIAIGYLFGKVAADNGRKTINKKSSQSDTGREKGMNFYNIQPRISQNGTLMLTLNFQLH